MTDTKKTALPEAPASVTYTITSKDGFNALFTIREMSGLALLKKMPAIEEKLLGLEYVPQVKKAWGEKKPVVYVEGKLCPKCEGKLKKIISKKDSKEYWSCENGKYDFQTKTKSGCDFFTSPDQYKAKEETSDQTDFGTPDEDY